MSGDTPSKRSGVPWQSKPAPANHAPALMEFGAANTGETDARTRSRHMLDPLAASGAYFEIYRADEVSLTSVLFSGGDWRWRFYMALGVIGATGGGYSSEAECRAAVITLRRSAQSAKIFSVC